jgi:hypothetical protein
LAKPCLVTGIPALATIALDSYSKKRIGRRRLATMAFRWPAGRRDHNSSERGRISPLS